MSVQLLTKHILEFLSLKGGCTGSSESTVVKNTTLSEITCHGSCIFIFANRADSGEMLHYEAFHQGLLCVQMYILLVYRTNRV